jgi:hypothetical protein
MANLLTARQNKVQAMGIRSATAILENLAGWTCADTSVPLAITARQAKMIKRAIGYILSSEGEGLRGTRVEATLRSAHGPAKRFMSGRWINLGGVVGSLVACCTSKTCARDLDSFYGAQR